MLNFSLCDAVRMHSMVCACVVCILSVCHMLLLFQNGLTVQAVFFGTEATLGKYYIVWGSSKIYYCPLVPFQKLPILAFLSHNLQCFCQLSLTVKFMTPGTRHIYHDMECHVVCHN